MKFITNDGVYECNTCSVDRDADIGYKDTSPVAYLSRWKLIALLAEQNTTRDTSSLVRGSANSFGPIKFSYAHTKVSRLNRY